MKKLAAILAGILLVTGTARGEGDAVYLAPTEAPLKSAALVWKGPSSESTGRWYSDAQIIKIDQRLTGCEDQLAVELFDRRVAEAKVGIPGWVYAAAGALIVGLVWGGVEVREATK